MHFDYFKVLDFPKHQKRERLLPWIRFGVANPKNPLTTLYPIGLVDSGSDITIIDYEFGENLGIDIRKGIKDKVYGVGGGSIEVYFHKIEFIIDNGGSDKPIIYQDLAGFTYESFPATMPQQTAILGTIGLFRNVDVTFRFPKSIIVESKK